MDALVAGLLGLKKLRSRDRYERAGFLLYGAAVAAAREPYLYATLGIPDTLDGRFDAISLYTFLLIHHTSRLPAPGPALAQAIFDAMFSDMDVTLREMGVSDLRVGKRVRAMWEAFHGRCSAYAAALDAADIADLDAALTRNIWRSTVPPPGVAAKLALLTLVHSRQLSCRTLGEFVAGDVRFQAAAETVL